MNPHQSSQTSNEHIRDSTLKQGEILDPKRFSEEENQLYQRVFCPKIKRKTLKLRSVRKKCAELVDSFYPITEVTYEAMKLRLIQLDRCSRQTILKYLGRPETRQIETVRHTIRTQNSERAKDHTFTHILPAKRGLVEVYGYASLVNKKGKLVFLLHHTYQTDLEKQFVSPPRSPPNESLNESSHEEVTVEFKDAFAYAKEHEAKISTSKNFLSFNNGFKCIDKNAVLQRNVNDEARDGDRERVFKREKKFEVSESKLSSEEKRLFSFYDSLAEASR